MRTRHLALVIFLLSAGGAVTALAEDEKPRDLLALTTSRPRERTRTIACWPGTRNGCWTSGARAGMWPTCTPR